MPGWYAVYALNALVLALALALSPDTAGYIAAPIFALSVMLPDWLARASTAAAGRARIPLARRLLGAARLLVPFSAYAEQQRFLALATLRVQKRFAELLLATERMLTPRQIPTFARALHELGETERAEQLAREMVRKLGPELPGFELQALSVEDLKWFRALGGGTEPKRMIVTGVLVVLNLLAFALELPGGAMDDDNLISLGALMLPMRRTQDAWRLLAACFLHFGWMHLLLNIFALFLFGRWLERAIGRVRFTIVYLGSGIGSMGAYALNAAIAAQGMVDIHRRASIVVGASGCIMGTIGGLIATTLRKREQRMVTLLLVMSIAAETLFDVFTPEAAMGVHLSGALIGAALAFTTR